MITHMNASREEKVSSMVRSLPSIRSSHLWISPVRERKGVRDAEMKLNARPHRSCSETGQEWSGGSLGLNVRAQLDSDRHGGNGTLFGDVPDFDGVGFASESIDLIIRRRRHCGSFTRHREKELARDGEAREEEKGGNTCDERAMGSSWWWWTEDEKPSRTNYSGFYTTRTSLLDLSRFLPAAEGRFDATQANLNPCDPKVNSLRLITGRL